MRTGAHRDEDVSLGLGTPEAEAALERLLECEEAGDFEDFGVEEYSARYADYYDE